MRFVKKFTMPAEDLERMKRKSDRTNKQLWLPKNPQPFCGTLLDATIDDTHTRHFCHSASGIKSIAFSFVLSPPSFAFPNESISFH